MSISNTAKGGVWNQNCSVGVISNPLHEVLKRKLIDCASERPRTLQKVEEMSWAILHGAISISYASGTCALSPEGIFASGAVPKLVRRKAGGAQSVVLTRSRFGSGRRMILWIFSLGLRVPVLAAHVLVVYG